MHIAYYFVTQKEDEINKMYRIHEGIKPFRILNGKLSVERTGKK